MNTLLIQIERRLHPKIKEVIAKSLVYYFTLKETREYRQTKYSKHPHILDTFETLITMAHRGFSGNYPENTVLAFSQALACGSDVIELDVQRTRDDVLVVYHDSNLQRLVGRPDFVRDLNYESLCHYAAKAGFTIPTLREVFQVLPANTLFNIEIKHESTSFVNWDTEKAVLECVKNQSKERQVIISAFNPMIVNRIRKLAPDISTAYLITQALNPLLIFLLSQIHANYLHVDLRYLQPKTIKKLKKKGLKILGYTLNTPEEYKRAKDLGLQGVITDYPDRFQAFLKTDMAQPTKRLRL